MEPIDAFEWLLTHFKRHMRLELTWLDVREVFAQADTYLEAYRQADMITEAQDEIRRKDPLMAGLGAGGDEGWIAGSMLPHQDEGGGTSQ